MSLLTENLAFIAKHNPVMHRALTGNNVTGDTVEYWPDSDNFAIYRDGTRVLVHSEFNREREIERLLRPIQPSDKTVVLFGFGNGKILTEIRQRFPALEHIVIVEPNVEIMRCFLEKHHFIETFSIFNKVSFLVGKPVAEAAKLLERLVIVTDILEKKISLVAPIAYRTLYADYYIALRQSIVGALRFFNVNKNTLETFRQSWQIHSWRNLKHISPDVGDFRNAFAGRPAVIVSAGPSLQGNIHLLRQLYDRALIIAVGSAMTILQSHGIVPHFRMAVDGLAANTKLFAKVDTATCPLIFGDHLFYEVVDSYQGPKIHMTEPGNYLFGKADVGAMPVRTGFSVANSALFLLMQYKCSPIIFMGQDLCFSRGKLHAEGAWDEEAEKKAVRKHIETVDVHGNAVYTDATFMGMKKTIEDTIALTPSLRFLNATEGGLAITGAPNVVLQDLLENELTESFPFAEEIAGLLQEEGGKLEAKRDKINKVVSSIEKDIDKIIEYCRKIDEKLIGIHQLIEANVTRKRVTVETGKLSVLTTKLDKIEYYSQVIKPGFAQTFGIRRSTVNYACDDWRQQWTGEIGLMRLENKEIWEYVARTQALIEEYRGKRKLNIVFE